MRYRCFIFIVLTLFTSCRTVSYSEFIYDVSSVYDVNMISEEAELSYKGVSGGFRDSASGESYYMVYFEDIDKRGINRGMLLLIKPLSSSFKNKANRIADSMLEHHEVTKSPIISSHFTLNNEVEFKILDALNFRFGKNEMVTYGNIDGLPAKPDAIAVEPKADDDFIKNDSDTIKRLWYLDESKINIKEFDANGVRRIGENYILPNWQN